MVQQVPDVAVVLRVDDGAELAVGHGQQDPLGRGLPHGGPASEPGGLEPDQEILDRGPSARMTVECAGVAEQLVEAGNEETDDALTAKVSGGYDVDDEFDPDVRLATRRRDQRIESEGRYVPTNGIDAKVRLDGHQIAVAAFPVEGEDLDASDHDALHQHEGQVRFAGTATAGNEEMLLEPVGLEKERVELPLAVGDIANLDLAGQGKGAIRRREG